MAQCNPVYRVRFTGQLFALTAVCTISLIAFAYHGAARELFKAWQTDEYSHGAVIPFIALLLAWHRLVAVRPALASSWWGLPVMLIAGLLLLVGTLAAFEAASDYGVMTMIIGLALAFTGRAATAAMAPGLFYLFFVVPLPHIVYSALSQHLQLLSSTMGVWFLDLFGIPVFQEGNVIDLGGYKLQVVDACSGLRYLFPLMSFGYLVAYLLEDRLWKRILIFFSVIPLAAVLNALRIALVGVTVSRWGNAMAEGLLHEFEGWTVFLMCGAALMAEMYVIKRIKPSGRFRLEYLGPAKGHLFSGAFRPNWSLIPAFILAAGLAFSFGTGRVEERPEIEPFHPSFSSFPETLGAWHARQRSIEPEILAGLQLDDYWLADYLRDNDKAPVNFLMAYYARQQVGTEAHSPANCIPGSGWSIESENVRTLPLADGGLLSFSQLSIRRGRVRQLVYYWFEERGHDITNTYTAKWYLLIDAVRMNRTDGALLRVTTPLTDNENTGDAQKRLDAFVQISYPAIARFIPAEMPAAPLISTAPSYRHP